MFLMFCVKERSNIKFIKKKDYWHYLEHDANNERFLFTWNKLFNSFHEKLWMYFNFKTQESRQVTHLQYTSWPDHGTPSPLELLEFYRYVSKAMEQHSEQKIIVHCRFDFAYFFYNALAMVSTMVWL